MFVELLKESIVMRGLLALMVIGAVLYMLIAGLAIPGELWGAAGVILGFFFGSRPTASVERAKEVASLKARLGE